MQKESIVFALSGAFFGLIVGWIIGSQQAAPVRTATAAPAAQQTAATTAPVAGGSGQSVQLNESEVRALVTAAEQRPEDVAVRVRLGNMMFDAERFTEAIRWYEQAIALDPKDINVSTDLGVSYYYTDQPDKAVAQLDKSLAIDPVHTKTLLNLGIVRAFGKQDLKAAAAAWEKVIQLAPDSPEGRTARQALDNMKAAHPEVGGTPAAAPKSE
jgi:cytochrome c-type biogenesis protein CcmH/NrfG